MGGTGGGLLKMLLTDGTDGAAGADGAVHHGAGAAGAAGLWFRLLYGAFNETQ